MCVISLKLGSDSDRKGKEGTLPLWSHQNTATKCVSSITDCSSQPQASQLSRKPPILERFGCSSGFVPGGCCFVGNSRFCFPLSPFFSLASIGCCIPSLPFASFISISFTERARKYGQVPAVNGLRRSTPSTHCTAHHNAPGRTCISILMEVILSDTSWCGVLHHLLIRWPVSAGPWHSSMPLSLS